MGFPSATVAGRISVLGNLFINNGCSWDYCAFDLLSNAPATALHPIPVLFGNTVVESVHQWRPGQLRCERRAILRRCERGLFNNVFAFNEDADLRLQGSNVDLDHNNLLTSIGTPASQSGNLAYVDPLFGGSRELPAVLRFTLAQCRRDWGVSVWGVRPDGNQRIYGPEVDIGAYENTVAIFGNGFETPF